MRGIQHKVVGFGLSGLMLLSASVPVPAQVDLKNTITTSGQGEVRVQPDSFEIQFAVETTAPTVSKAREENTRKMQQIIAALKGLNIAGLKLDTQNVNVYPIYENPPAEPVSIRRKQEAPKVIAYRFNNTLRARVTGQQAAAVGEIASRVMGTGLDAGANQMQSMNFFVDDLNPVRREALQKAVQDARANAEAMAQAADVTMDGVYSIEGTPQYGYMGRAVYAEMASMKGGDMRQAGAPIPVEPGETTVNSNVTVRFTFH